MLKTIRHGAKRVLGWLRPLVRPQAAPLGGLPSITPTELHAIWNRVEAYTMTGVARVAALVRSIAHIEQHGIEGDIVECGVWRGGSMMAAALALLRRRSRRRRLHLFDTFAAMPPPGPWDRHMSGEPAAEWLIRHDPVSCAAGPVRVESVRAAMARTRYPADRICCVEGDVRDTLPRAAPAQIALLRLDTDWYASTWHELEHLFPRLAPGGVMIVDDYGHWQGAQRAVDEYFAAYRLSEPLHEIDYTGRLVIKHA